VPRPKARSDAAAAEAREAGAWARELEGELAEARECNEELSDRVAELEEALREPVKRQTTTVVQRQGGVRGLLGREGKVPSSEG
jgi:HPt (histidine-containing phosphotransfer) domain-containing protein